jgi:PRTRC genetic system protein D
MGQEMAVPSTVVLDEASDTQVFEIQATTNESMNVIKTLQAAAIDTGHQAVKYRYVSGTQELHGWYPAVCGPVTGATVAALGPSSDALPIRVGGGAYLVGKDAHKFGDVYQRRAFDPDYCKTPAYKALTLGSLCQMAIAEGVDQLRIGMLCCALPLETWSTHAQTLKAMCLGTHVVELQGDPRKFVIEVLDAIVVAQPQGALFASGATAFQQNSSRNTVVVDMGGGTTNFFFSVGATPDHSRSGCIPRGTIAALEKVADQISPGYSQKSHVVQRLDQAIATNAATVELDGEAKPLPLHVITQYMLDICGQVRQGVKDFTDVDRLLLTGGGAPHLMRAFGSLLPHRAAKIEIHADPVHANCRGFLHIAREFSTARA